MLKSLGNHELKRAVFISFICMCSLILLTSCNRSIYAPARQDNCKIKQITSEQKNHYLGVYNPWSPDDNWIVYSCGGNDTNKLIEKVNIHTGEKITLYKIDDNNDLSPGCGTASYCPSKNKVVFIHGPRVYGPGQKYEFWRRSAAAIIEPNYDEPVFIDGRDVTLPYTPGALRGGTHCHQWSYDGQYLAFTYNDMIMAQLEKKTGQDHDLRTIGVCIKGKGVRVDHDPAGENFDGQWFTVLLVEVTADPKPGSDEISKAYENCWVGSEGYLKNDKWQRAIAFKGNVLTGEGKIVPEIFVVDLPDRLISGDRKPIEGTEIKMPFPPANTKWRRITFTAEKEYPKLSQKPRFWLRSSHDGKRIYFVGRDKNNINQIFSVSPLGGDIKQLTFNQADVIGSPSVSSDDLKIAYICDGSIMVTDTESGDTKRLTEKTISAPSNPMWANEENKIVFNRKIFTGGKSYTQIFIVEL